MHTATTTFVVLGLLSAAAAGDVLLNNGSINSPSRTVNAQFTIYQPFDVPEPGWETCSIGLDGFIINDPNGTGVTGTLLPSDANGQPNPSLPIASEVFHFGPPHTPPVEQWRDHLVAANLAPGRYWMRMSNGGDDFNVAAMWSGTSGLGSYSLRADGVLFPSAPVAVRVWGQTALTCLADINEDQVANGIDVGLYLQYYAAGSLEADMNCDGMVNGIDVGLFLQEYAGGCS